MADCTADISMILLARFEACGLREQGMKSRTGSDICGKLGVLDRRRLHLFFQYSRFGRNLARCLYHRLKIPLYRYGAVQFIFALGEDGSTEYSIQSTEYK